PPSGDRSKAVIVIVILFSTACLSLRRPAKRDSDAYARDNLAVFTQLANPKVVFFFDAVWIVINVENPTADHRDCASETRKNFLLRPCR
ncbi:MAG: hypothetical protein AAAB35_23850, partial [Phyllobacterium sp.]|uniref:hypothetical protein n=1 Tax=Phyllobacterium sp. TaxID=1871046 RepID=UPI0030F10AE8